MDFDSQREQMVSEQILGRGIRDQQVLDAFRNVPRHLFVPQENREFAYQDYPLPIGENQTISQPYIVALMTQELEVKKGDKVLEIGTGSGYQAAILNHLGAKVYSVERVPSLAEKASETLHSLGYDVEVKAGDGTLGWEENSPYDRIIVTAAAPVICSPWIEQLKIGGKIVLPLGMPLHQELTVVKKVNEGDVEKSVVCGCVFVPLIGKYGYK
jgi:protein-L-isoaspartate(D-aspartate) O-methyltransferase